MRQKFRTFLKKWFIWEKKVKIFHFFLGFCKEMCGKMGVCNFQNESLAGPVRVFTFGLRRRFWENRGNKFIFLYLYQRVVFLSRSWHATRPARFWPKTVTGGKNFAIFANCGLATRKKCVFSLFLWKLGQKSEIFADFLPISRDFCRVSLFFDLAHPYVRPGCAGSVGPFKGPTCAPCLGRTVMLRKKSKIFCGFARLLAGEDCSQNFCERVAVFQRRWNFGPRSELSSDLGKKLLALAVFRQIWASSDLPAFCPKRAESGKNRKKCKNCTFLRF